MRNPCQVDGGEEGGNEIPSVGIGPDKKPISRQWAYNRSNRCTSAHRNHKAADPIPQAVKLNEAEIFMWLKL